MTAISELVRQKPFREERLQLIYERLRSNGKVYTKGLAEEFEVSPSSIRMDLAALEERGLLRRTHGGAILPTGINGTNVVDLPGLKLRMGLFQREKEAIARLAATLVNDGDALMIDGGTTTLGIPQHLMEKRDLTIITNAISHLSEFAKLTSADIYLAGGWLYWENGVVVGDIANDVVSRFNAGKAILGIDGVSPEEGLTMANPHVSSTAIAKRKMIEASRQLIIVCDHSKLGRVCLMPVAPTEAMTYLVTDSGADPALIRQIEDQGPKVLVASSE